MFRDVGRAFRLALVLGVTLACSNRTPSAPESAISPVAMEASLGNRFVKAGASQGLVARIELSTPRRTSTARPPVNIALVIDTSGSMEGKAIEDARAASLAFLDSLSKDDRLSVIVFNSKAEVLLGSTRIDDANMTDVRRKLSTMKATGTTDMAQGLRLAMNEVERNIVQNGVNRVVMLGDGVPNDERLIDGMTSEAASRGISITTLGLGNDYDETLMGRIAQQTGGKFSYVEDSSKVASFFREEVVRLHQVVARNAYLEIRPGPGVVVQGVVGRPTASRADRALTVGLGDLSLGEKHELVVELAANPTKDGANVEVLDAVLHWQDSVGGATHEDRVFVGAKSTSDEAQITSGKDTRVVEAAARMKDAAATLQKLDEQRAKTRSSNDEAAPRNRAPTKQPFPAPAAVPEMTAEQVRRVHADALQNFQANH
jgi:Ca-activated chloride channel family protein